MSELTVRRRSGIAETKGADGYNAGTMRRCEKESVHPPRAQIQSVEELADEKHVSERAAPSAAGWWMWKCVLQPGVHYR